MLEPNKEVEEFYSYWCSQIDIKYMLEKSIYQHIKEIPPITIELTGVNRLIYESIY